MTTTNGPGLATHTAPTAGLTPFTNLARTGQTQAWRWILAILAILTAWLVLGSIPLLMVGVDARGYPGYLALSASFPLMLAGIWFAVRVLHRRRLRTLITNRPRVRFDLIGLGAGFWLAAITIAAVVEFLASGQTVRYTLQPGVFLAVMPVVLVLTTLQSFAEEVLFRGYLLQGMALWTRRTGILVLLNASIFAVAHWGNPETASDLALLLLYYGLFGALLTYITLRSNSIELAVGIHVANNLFGALILRPDNSALTTNTVWTAETLNAGWNLTGFLIAAAVFASLCGAWKLRAVRAAGDRTAATDAADR